MQEKPSRLKRALRFVLSCLSTALLIAVFYVAVVMGQPQESSLPTVEAAEDQPLLTALAAPVRITDSRDIALLAESFPAPVMHAAQDHALVLVEGECRDVPFENGLGRSVTLTYRTEDFELLTVTSLYPAQALALIPQADYTFTGRLGKTLAGLRSVPMQNATTLRMHAQGTEALYVFTCPRAADEVLTLWTSALQLYKAD